MTSSAVPLSLLIETVSTAKASWHRAILPLLDRPLVDDVVDGPCAHYALLYAIKRAVLLSNGSKEVKVKGAWDSEVFNLLIRKLGETPSLRPGASAKVGGFTQDCFDVLERLCRHRFIDRDGFDDIVLALIPAGVDPRKGSDNLDSYILRNKKKIAGLADTDLNVLRLRRIEALANKIEAVDFDVCAEPGKERPRSRI